jgi:hypothetical protein
MATKPPAHLIYANIRHYERLLADPKTLQMTRDVVADLLADARKELEDLVIAEARGEAPKTVH